MLKMRARSRTIKKSVESQKVLEALDNYLESNLDADEMACKVLERSGSGYVV